MCTIWKERKTLKMKFLFLTSLLIAMNTDMVLAAKGGLKSTTYNCDEGCGLDVVGHGPPVCGTDGITYFNKCLAFCQNVEIRRPGVCPGGNPIHPSDDSYVREGKVSKEQLNRFHGQKFKYVAKRQYFPAPDGLSDTIDSTGYEGSKDGQLDGIKLRALRITVDGDEYMSEEIEQTELTTDIFEPFTGKDDIGGDRDLGIIGTDDRTRITGTTSMPYRLIGRLATGCTGTVISRTSVLTAAHCVYHMANSMKGETKDYWMSDPNFSPAQSGSNKPYGTFSRAYTTIYSTYPDKSVAQQNPDGVWINGDWDIAVITYYPQNNQLLGDKVGYAGLITTKPSTLSLQTARVTGYPGDKPNQSEMWRSVCDNSYASTSYYQVKFACDIVGGNSGSSLLSPDGYTHGVLWGGNSAYNLGNILRENGRYTNIINWSGRGDVGNIRTDYDYFRCMDYNFNNAEVYMYAGGCHNGNNQNWYFDITTKQIKSKHDNKCLDYDTANGNVIMYTCNGGSNQKWNFNPTTKEVKTDYNNNCLDYAYGNGNKMVMWSCHGGSNQKFNFPDKFWT